MRITFQASDNVTGTAHLIEHGKDGEIEISILLSRKDAEAILFGGQRHVKM